MLVAFNKPFGVLSQFTPDGSPHRPLAEFGFPKGIYPVGRLDADSEGLLLLTDERPLVDLLLHPRHGHPRTYLAQVERVPSREAIDRLRAGPAIRGQPTRPCDARLLDAPPELPPRDPPIRMRMHIPTAWLELRLREGKNRQVRRMTAAVGHPTLRLVRTGIGGLDLRRLELAPGRWRPLEPAERALLQA